MPKVKYEKGQLLHDIGVNFAGAVRTLKFPGKAAMLDIQGAISKYRDLGMLARISAGAIALCLDQTTGFQIKTNPKDYKFDFLEFCDTVLDELLDRDLEPDEIVTVGVEIIQKISELFKKDIKDAENFLEAQPAISAAQAG